MPHPFHAPGTRRLFVCLLAEWPLRHTIARLRTDWRWPAHRWWTEAERLHVTVADPLYFTQAEQARLQAVLRSLRYSPFALQFQRARVGGNTLALQAGRCPPFKALQNQVAMLARQANVPFQHLPSPHVTLSRNAAGQPSPRLAEPIDWPVQAVCLVWSQLKPEVGQRRYEVLAHYPADDAPEPTHPQLAFGF